MTMKNLPREWKYIERIKELTTKYAPEVQRQSTSSEVTLGDDAFATSISSDPGQLTMCQDLMIEGVHFDTAYTSPADLGHKVLAVNLSDFAAMGATPKWAQISLAIPKNFSEEKTLSWLDEFYSSMLALASRHNVRIAGGDTSASPNSLFVDVSVVGFCEKPLTRRGTQEGDLLLCSGPLGLSALGMKELRKNPSAQTSATKKHLRPEPRLDLLSELQIHSHRIHALIDISDGLISESQHLLNSSSKPLGLGIELDKLSVYKETDTKSAQQAALWGGEDYELLMSVAPGNYEFFPHWHKIGTFNSSGHIELIHTNGDREIVDSFQGWEHFS